MQELAQATDTQLRNIAQYKSLSDFANSPNRRTENGFAKILPVVDSVFVGASTQGSLGKKIVAGGTQLKDWGIFLAVTGLYNKAINKIVSKSETLQNFRENSPFAYGIANTVLAVTAGVSGVHYVNKGFQKYIAPHIPQSVKNAVKGVLGSPDKSSFGQAVNGGMKTFAKKYPTIAKTANAVARFALPLLCLGLMVSLAVDMIKAKSDEKTTYKKLEEARLNAAQALAKRAEGE